MLETAIVQTKQNTFDISDYGEFKAKVATGGFLQAYWCGDQQCEEKIKDETGADIRVIPFDSEDTSAKCIYCQNRSKSRPIFARGY